MRTFDSYRWTREEFMKLPLAEKLFALNNHISFFQSQERKKEDFELYKAEVSSLFEKICSCISSIETDDNKKITADIIYHEEQEEDIPMLDVMLSSEGRDRVIDLFSLLGHTCSEDNKYSINVFNIGNVIICGNDCNIGEMDLIRDFAPDNRSVKLSWLLRMKGELERVYSCENPSYYTDILDLIIDKCLTIS